MSKENARKFYKDLQANEELKAKIKGLTDSAELVKAVNEAGYDATLEELTEAEREIRAEQAAKSDAAEKELSAEELSAAAGGMHWNGDDAPDGHELGCICFYYSYAEQEERNWWCNNTYYCHENRSYEPEYWGD